MTRAAAALVAFAAMAAACGSDGEADTAAPTSAGGATATTAAGAAAAGGEDPASWGVKDKKVIGPAGYTIDLSKCPSNWSDTEGVTATEIRLVQTFPFSGNNAISGNISNAIKAYFEHVNATEGGIGGKKIAFTVKDDGYEAARSKANVDELVETVKPLAFMPLSGTPGTLAVYDKLHDMCVPNLMNGTGHQLGADPVNHPWSTGSYLSYPSEAAIWAEYLAKTIPGGTVAGLFVNSDFGASYRIAFEKEAVKRGLKIAKIELFDQAAATITNEMTTLASTNADALVLGTFGVFCSQSMKALSELSWKPKVKIIDNPCSGPAFFKPAGDAGKDFVTAQYRKDGGDVSFANDPDVKAAQAILSKAGLDEKDSYTNWGAWWALPLVDIMKKANARPGGISRTNLMLAAWSAQYKHPLNRGGIKFEMNGLKDAYFTEGAVLTRYAIEPGEEVGRQVEFGDVIEQNGTGALCAWDGKACK
ncbi:MAG: ABC transporter substrate-binding protein [Acidimicrobiales bacterium]